MYYCKSDSVLTSNQVEKVSTSISLASQVPASYVHPNIETKAARSKRKNKKISMDTDVGIPEALPLSLATLQ